MPGSRWRSWRPCLTVNATRASQRFAIHLLSIIQLLPPLTAARGAGAWLFCIARSSLTRGPCQWPLPSKDSIHRKTDSVPAPHLSFGCSHGRRCVHRSSGLRHTVPKHPLSIVRTLRVSAISCCQTNSPKAWWSQTAPVLWVSEFGLGFSGGASAAFAWGHSPSCTPPAAVWGGMI